MRKDFITGKVLSKINKPKDIKALSIDELNQLCIDLRDYYIDVVSVKGGHFAAGLGVIELTVAIHYVFDCPHDDLIWDVGHQAYAHKILTERKDAFPNIRKTGGISGFPKRDESPYDSFGVGHASTSISAALGMAIADKLSGDTQKQHIAIIGDGALTGGLAFEGLNNAGVSDANLLIVYNDNEMSIDLPVGAISKQSEMINDADYEAGFIPNSNRKRRVKANNLSPAAFFESLNIPYHGPVDGHELENLIQKLSELKRISGPKIVHVKTIKGKGYAPAEQDRVRWHAPGQFDKLTGEILAKDNNNKKALKFQEVFGHTLVQIAQQNPNILAVTPAMPSGSSLNIFMKAFPEKSFDVGIAEEHAVTFSAGLATKGYKVFCSIYSTFLQRAYDQVIHDVALQNLPVVFCIDRAGLVGEDGATHHGVFDISYLSAIPNMLVSAPMNEHELRNLMFLAAQNTNGPFAIRYPRGLGYCENWKNQPEPITIGKAVMLHKGEKLAVLSTGTIGNNVLKAICDLKNKPSVYHFPFIKPMDTAILDKINSEYQHIICIEEGSIIGGFGSQITQYLAQKSININVECLGLPDAFINHGSTNDLLKQVGLDVESIQKTIIKWMKA